jgi:hypothetical protein
MQTLTQTCIYSDSNCDCDGHRGNGRKGNVDGSMSMDVFSIGYHLPPSFLGRAVRICVVKLVMKL